MLHDRLTKNKTANSSLVDVSERVAQLEQYVGQLRSSVDRVALAAPDGNLDEKAIRRLLKARRAREQQLGKELFADPAWDILLEAYAAELGQKRVSVSALCDASSVPSTTALRWVKTLEEGGWLRREADVLDGRRTWIELTPTGYQRLTRYFHSIWPDLAIV